MNAPRISGRISFLPGMSVRATPHATGTANTIASAVTEPAYSSDTPSARSRSALLYASM